MEESLHNQIILINLYINHEYHLISLNKKAKRYNLPQTFTGASNSINIGYSVNILITISQILIISFYINFIVHFFFPLTDNNFFINPSISVSVFFIKI